jgi:hypothetical protein
MRGHEPTLPENELRFGSWPLLILMAKSEIHTIDLQYEPENPVCQRAHSCETDFAISITFGETGQFGGLATFSCPQEDREDRAVTEEKSLHSPR